MAINLSDNIKISGPLPVDSRYFNNLVPYTGITQVNLIILSGERYVGLTVNINNIEYWYSTGIGDGNLVIKTAGGTLTGATNGLSLFGVSGTSVGLGGTITGSTTITISSGGTFVIGDSRTTPVGIIYAGDYSTSYTDRSLVDKAYVNAVAIGLQPKTAVWVATSTGDTGLDLTGGTFGGTIDSIAILDTQRVLIKNQSGTTAAVDNGIYVYSGGSNTFYRAPDFDGSPQGEITQGALIPVLTGNTNRNTLWVLITPDPITGGTTPLSFTPFSTPGNYVGGTGIDVSPTTISLNLATQAIVNNAITGVTNIGSGDSVCSSVSGHILTLNTIVGSGGTCVQKVGDEVIICSSTVSGSQAYSGETPSAVNLCGITIGYQLTGKTVSCIIQDLLVPELFGSITAPSTSISLSASASPYEVGTVISETVCGVFNRGCINPQYCSVSDKRSGCANAYCFTGTGMPAGWQTCALTPGCATNASYTIVNGSQSWGVCTRYDCGEDARGSKGTVYCTKLLSGNTLAASASITGLYPYYYGKLTCGSCPPVTNSLVTGGTKVVASSTGTVTVTFGSAGEWTWLAIPSLSTSKTCWYVNALDNGRINNAPSDKYPDECIIAITSGQGCWSSINYKVYMSGYAATDANPIQFRNS
jgi:hypothetical protein